VVASARGGVGEFVEDGVDGLLAWSDGDMVQAMLTLLTQPAVRRRMTLHNRTVTPRATWSAVLDATDDLYRQAQALSGGRSTSRGRVFV
jgi:glycosyltransferase involved in cell wall biosynthesis